MRKQVFVALVGVLMAAVSIHAVFAFTPDVGSVGPYSISTDPGTYRITVQRFKRHGPETIERTPFQLESSSQVISYQVTGGGALDDVSVSVRSDGGNYLLELNGNRYNITDQTTNTRSEGPTIPASSLARSTSSVDLPTALESAGLTRGSERVWRGRNVVVYEAVGPIVGQLNRPQANEAVGLPVVYDLAPVSQRAGVYVDTETGLAIRTYRYAVDARGNETLIESLEVLSIESGV